MKKQIKICNDWTFKDEKGKISNVRIPHNMVDIPFNYFDQKMFQVMGEYQKELNYDFQNDKIYKIRFDAVGHEADIYLNDKFILKHQGGYDTFEMDITDFIDFSKTNILKVVVNASEDLNIPPFGNVVDYLCYGGIYKEVSLIEFEKIHLTDLYAKGLEKDGKWFFDLDISLSDKSNGKIFIFDSNNQVLIDQKKSFESSNKFSFEALNPILWDLDNPYLYKARIELDNGEYLETKFGLRKALFKKDGFYLNDKKIKIVGLNRHQSFPYVGYAVSGSLDYNDVKILKTEIGVNALRTCHYMQSKYLYQAADELGILVFTETPGWQYLGDNKWKDLVIQNMKAMVKMCKNHPSVILYGARINESLDDHELYTKTNKLLHELDPYRQTGGVRYSKKSEELEDVYTYNDFIDPREKRALEKKENVVTNLDMPYFVSEFNGHMFPTKMYDNQARQEEHLYRLTRAYDELYGDPNILGLFTWHMFDYNTHKDFGSKDKICYHGVLDMFRNHKLASNALKFNLKEPYLFISNNRAPGDFPASQMRDIICYTNADKIEVYKNDLLISTLDHSKSNFKNIPNAPIVIDDFIGNQLVTVEGYTKKVANRMKAVLRAILSFGGKIPLKYKLMFLNLKLFHGVDFEKGYELYRKYIGDWGSKEVVFKILGYKDGKVFKTITLDEPKKLHLDIKVSSSILHEGDTYDMALVRIEALDQSNNKALYYQEGIKLETSGPIEIVGPDVITFKGGSAGIIIKTTGKIGQAKLKLKALFEEKEIEFEII